MPAPTADQQRRDRLIAHMNRDHARELSQYLRHHAGLSASAAASPALREVSFDAMVIHAPRDGPGGRAHAVPFTPPLSSWDEARARFTAMSEESRKALGLSDVYVSEFLAPQGSGWAIFGAVCFYFCCAGSLPWVKPGTALWSVAQKVFPGGAIWFRWIVRTLFVPVIGIHITETVLFDRMRLLPHGIERWTRLWWLWSLSCFLEGLFAWRRFGALVSQKTAEKNAKKH